MPSASNQSLQHQLKDRLLNLTPRAFEFFAGDLLNHIGLQEVKVTRHRGDGGIDATGILTSQLDFVRISTGVQVKKYQQNIRRVEIDQFIGALSGHHQHGIFITTSKYAETARKKAKETHIHIDTIDGDQIVQIMYRRRLGLRYHFSRGITLDKSYFDAFEEAEKFNESSKISETSAIYLATEDEADFTENSPNIITLESLSYLLRRDRYTVRDWIMQGKLIPDQRVQVGHYEKFFFRGDRLKSIQEQFHCVPIPTDAMHWRQDFLEFSKSRTMTRSYKPVLLQALLKHIDREGVAAFDAVAAEFREFYIQRFRRGEVVEFDAPDVDNPETRSIDEIKRLIIKNPLQRFIIQGFLRYDKTNDTICIVPELWNELRYTEVLEVQRSIEEQIRYYYAKTKRK